MELVRNMLYGRQSLFKYISLKIIIKNFFQAGQDFLIGNFPGDELTFVKRSV